MEPLRVLSLGAGVQSTALLMLVLNGEIKCDAAIFADTGWEPQAVYEHLEQIRALAWMKGFPIHIVSSGNIRDTERQKDFYDAPYFLLNEDGSHGMARRQCTHQLKIRPIRVKVRELMEERGIKARPGAVVQYLGISFDEMQRMKPADVKFIEHQFPLVDRRWKRADCLKYLREQGLTAPRSACIGCPYHSDREWRDLKLNSPEEFADAVAFELEIQNTDAGLRGKPFLHASRQPLDTIDFSNAEDRGQLTFDAECEGMCGV
jgi:hypothetical protein